MREAEAVGAIVKEIYKTPPKPVRHIALVVLIVLALPCMFVSLPLGIVCLWCAAVMTYYSLVEPENSFALQQDERNRKEAERLNKFIDALYLGGVLDEDTTIEDVKITSPAPLVFDIELRQVGKTEEALRKTAEASLNAMESVAVEIRRTDPSHFLVIYSQQMPAERLAASVCRYKDLKPATSIEALPIGTDIDGNPVCINLESRNCLIGGNPRSGKSVALAAMLCGLCRCSNECITVLSPKVLDFQEFAPRVRLIQDPSEMLEYLTELREEAERRKVWCVKNRAKQIKPPDYEKVGGHLTTIIDEFAVIRATTTTDEKGKTVKTGEQIQAAVFSLVAETGFSASSFVLCVQKASGASGISTDLRDLISGNRISFATETPEATKMVLGEFSQDAPCHLITTSQKGVGYISQDGQPPRPFRGALTTREDEEKAARQGKKK